MVVFHHTATFRDQTVVGNRFDADGELDDKRGSPNDVTGAPLVLVRIVNHTEREQSALIYHRRIRSLSTLRVTCPTA